MELTKFGKLLSITALHKHLLSDWKEIIHKSFKPLTKENLQSAVRFRNGRYTGHTNKQNYGHCSPCKLETNIIKPVTGESGFVLVKGRAGGPGGSGSK